jgi:tetratricopeptide (TPR) repeat protein
LKFGGVLREREVRWVFSGVLQRRGLKLFGSGALVCAVFAAGATVEAGQATTEPRGAAARQAGLATQAKTGDPRFEEVEVLMQQGAIDDAKKKLLELLAHDPSTVEGYNLLGIICTSESDYAGALAAFEQALKIDPNSTRTQNNLGNTYVAEGKLELAEKEFRSVLKLDPANADANYNLGLVLIADGAPAEAIAHLQRVRPATLPARFNLVRAYLRAGRVAEGLKTATEISAQHGSDVQVHTTLGVLLASEKQYRAAGLELEKANALQPETFEILYNLGQTYLRAKEYSKAELAVSRALKLKPDSPDALYLMAQVYSEQMRSVDALDLLARAHKLAPENTDVIFQLARVSMSQNYFEDAIPLLESGLKLAPRRADLHAALGESYFMAGKTEKAIEEFNGDSTRRGNTSNLD